MKRCLLVILTMLFAMFFGLHLNTVKAVDTLQTLSGTVEFIFSNGTYNSTDRTITWDSQYMTMEQRKGNGSNVNSANISSPLWYSSNFIYFTPKENVIIKTLHIKGENNWGSIRLNDSTWTVGGVTHTSKTRSFGSDTLSVTNINSNNVIFVDVAREVKVTRVYYEYETTVTATTVSLNKSNTSLNQGSTFQLVADVHALSDSNKTVTWSSSNTDIATVDSNGLVTAKYFSSVTYPDGRDVTITAKTPDNATATCTVHVRTLAETQDTLRIYHQLSFSYARELSENVSYKLQAKNIETSTSSSYMGLDLGKTSSFDNAATIGVEYEAVETRTYFYIYVLDGVTKKYLCNSSNLVLSENKTNTDGYLWYFDINGFIANKSNDYLLVESENSFTLISQLSDGYLPCYFVGEKNQPAFQNVSITYQIEGNQAFYNGVVEKFGTSYLNVKFIVNGQEYLCDLYRDESKGTYCSRFTITDIPEAIWDQHFTVTAKLIAYTDQSRTTIKVEGNTIVEENLYSVTDIAHQYLINNMDNENVKNIAYYLTKLVGIAEVANVN